MRKLFYLVVSIVILGLIISGCIFHVVPPLGQDGSIDIVKNDVFFEIDLIAGQHTIAGSITVSNDDENLFIIYETVDNWLINETHLYVGTTIPTNSAPGKFPYKHEELGGVTTDTYEIPLEDLGVGPCDKIYIAAHADLVKGETEETGWAKGVKIEPGKNWAMYFNYQVWPCGSEIPEPVISVFQEIDLTLGGVIEVTDPQSPIEGVKLRILPISTNKAKKIIAKISIGFLNDVSFAELPDYQGFLRLPVVVQSDILFKNNCILEIPYNEQDLNNAGVDKGEKVNLYQFNQISSNWEKLEIENKRGFFEIISYPFKSDDINKPLACTVLNSVSPADLGHPQPGDLLYKLGSILPWEDQPNGWRPGHVGIYVGELTYDDDGDPHTPPIPYNVIEATFDGGVQRNYFNPIDAFGRNSTYMGARQPEAEIGTLTSDKRNKIIWYVHEKLGSPFALTLEEIYSSLYKGTARGVYSKGAYQDGYTCVGLAEAAYEFAGLDLVSDKDEGNLCTYELPYCILTPAEQYKETDPAEGYSVSGKVTDSQGVKIPDVTLNFELVTFNNNHSDSFDVTTNSNGDWSSDKLGREWNVTPQKDGYTFEPSTIKVKEDANDIDFTGTFITGSQYIIQWSTAESNGWANPLGEGKELITSTSYDYDSPIYLNNWGKRHVGIDVHAQLDSNVFSIADGTIRKIVRGSDPGKMVVIIEHANSNNEDLFAIYGHVLARSDLKVNSEIETGEKIGVIKKAGSLIHLHFGINLSSDISDFIFTNSDGQWGWGRIPDFAIPSDYDWVDPTDYLNTHQTKAVVSNVVAVYWTDHYPSNSQNIEHLINVFWDPYPEASGYKVYRSVNGMVETEPIYSGPGELLYDKNVVQWHDFSNIVVGNTYSYYVTAFGDGWETAPSQETGTINTFLPPIYLVSPSDEETINSSTPTFEWSPVGGNPGGNINFGTTELWVKDLTDDKVIWDISFNDMTTYNATYNQDGQASPLILGHSYAWEVTSYGYVDNIQVAISQSEYWEFTFGTSTGSVHNLTKGTYYDTIQAALNDADSLGGDTIEVADGTYNESITFPTNKVVTLQSASGIRDNVIIQGANNFATVTTNVSSTGTTLRGFTITHTGGNTGRGIYIGSGNLIVDNCIISGNTTADHGGGIYNVSGTLTIASSTISDNTATYSGGGINNYDGTIDITSSTIYSNTTTADQGGGIYNDGTLDITSSTISNNTATRGGGINNYGTLTIASSIISDNSAANNKGGGIYSSVTLTITSSTISDNTAAVDGGGIHNCGTLTITGSTISDNTSGRYGGGIGNDNGTLTIASSTISNNTADDVGGGIGSFSGTLTITGSIISGNNVSQQAGGIYLGGTGTITIGGESPADKNTICGNYKSGYSPSLDQQIRDDSESLYETYKYTNYISAYCGMPSGPVHNLTKDTYYDTIQAALSDADSLGGDTIEVADGTYDESIGFGNSKKIILQSINGASSTIIRGDNDSTTITIGIYNPGATLEGFTITHADGLIGRGIYMGGGTLNINNCTISGNTADNQTGGGIYNKGTLTITGSTISGNSTTHSGGGIHNGYHGILTIINSIVSANSTELCGGGIYSEDTLTITGSTISGNTAAIYAGGGGGIHNHNGTLTITSSTVSGNSGADYGGGICNVYGSSTITGSTVSGNSADWGGGINNTQGTLTITGSTLSNNSANFLGGAIHNYEGTIGITGNIISHNTANQDGGGIYLGSSGTINIGGEITDDKNTICGNCKTGEDPSLDQQIRDDFGSLYETYKDTNYISAYCGVPSGPVHNLTEGTYYDTIQAALDDAASGDTIEVDDGTYTENVGIIKDHLTLKSKNGAEKTTIEAADGNGSTLVVQADYILINGFTIEGAGAYYFGDRRGGIQFVPGANYCTISNNIISNNTQGIFIFTSNNNIISNNIISNNSIRGILLEAADYNIISNNIIDLNGNGIDVHPYYGLTGTYYSNSNTIINNTISNNGAGIRISGGSGNLAYLNNLVDNNTNGSSSSLVTNPWNSPEEITYSYSGNTYTNYLGNYWSNYMGNDIDGNGIGDIPYIIDEDQDNYPLIEPFENY